uniref:Solute carrier family 37 member 1 n=1 Tax=Sphenodon punctatus TaxID=8508 RepID=A0A8D0HCX2_SPHPU
MAELPPGIRVIVFFTRDQWYRAFIFVLTFLLYASFHLSRKPISIVKAPVSDKNAYLCISSVTYYENAFLDKRNYKQLLGALDYSFLCAYAVGMYLSGIIGERLPIRYYLTAGMLASGLFTAMFGLGYFYNIHSLWFYIMAQIANGLVQTTGWPSVVTCLGNWFGKGRRGLIMGLWNSHTSVGNILGSLIAGYWVSTSWGLSFVVPGVIIAVMGIVCFLFLIERYMNGIDRFRIQKPTLNNKETIKPQDPEKQSLLPDSENYIMSLNRSVAFNEESRNGMSAISFVGALQIPVSTCIIVSYSFVTWLMAYILLIAKEHLDPKRAGDLSTLFDVGGIFGGILAGVISDRSKKRASTCGMMLLLAAPTLYMFSAISKMGIEATIVMLLISGALVNGPYALITTAVSADLGTHKSLKGNARALSTVTAIIDGTGSVGAAVGPLLAGLISPSGWNNVFYMLMMADACALLLLLRLIRKELRCRFDQTL